MTTTRKMASWYSWVVASSSAAAAAAFMMFVITTACIFHVCVDCSSSSPAPFFLVESFQYKHHQQSFLALQRRNHIRNQYQSPSDFMLRFRSTSATTREDRSPGPRRTRRHYSHQSGGNNSIGRKDLSLMAVSSSLSASTSMSMSTRTRTRMRTMARPSSASSSTDTAVPSSQAERRNKKKTMVIWISRLALMLGIFFVGFRSGVWYNTLAKAASSAAVKTATRSTGVAAAAGAATTAASSSSAASSALARKFPIVTTVLVAVLMRDVWRAIPKWAKPRLIDRAIRDTQSLFGITTKEVDASARSRQDDFRNGNGIANERGRKKDSHRRHRRQDKSSSSSSNNSSSNDIGDIDTLFGKINAIKTIMTKSIDSVITNDDDGVMVDDDDENEVDKKRIDGTSTDTGRPSSKRAARKKTTKKSKFNLSTAFFTYQNLMKEYKEAQSPVRDQWYQQHRREKQEQQQEQSDDGNHDVTTYDDLKRLPLLLDMADWAYDEDPSGRSLKELLHEQNYTLVKHDQTTLPGYLGHYVAIPTNDDTDESMKKTLPISSFPSTRQDQRRAVIGVKGTSGLEDFLTDLCGASVELDVDTTEWRRKMRVQALPPEAKSDGGGVVIRAHEGVAIASRRLADDLKPIITNLLLPQNYKLTIVGHSLGAAGASLLAVMLLAEISELEPSQLEVFAFASPPTLDLVTARAVEPFTTTIINNNDVIPRMNVAPVEATVGMLKAVDDRRRRRDDELQAMAQTYRQQHRWWYQRWKNRSQFIDRKRAVVSAPLMMDTEFLEVLKTVTNNKAPATDDSVDDNPNHLYVPGKVVLMYKSWSNVTTAQIESLTTTSPNDKTDSSSLTPINIIMSNIDGTHDTITTTTANLVQTVTTTTSDDVAPVTGIPPTAADRVVICNATSPPIRTLELDARMVDDHMTTGYRQSLQSVLSKEASP